ncbi:alkaline phosphatase D family protein [Rhodococcus sp. BP-149]|uniref:alkaline phosphatase D family protein n=1 Tax=unclassified Rhodococcus (in: high G+C Gram-positive bacteria) TaxID=192944 RepID=UPI001C9A53FB|nr:MULTISPECIES: alkaline phosphatase D family protein [unclassified Rhodococcus (in: high G+C Gram-positive bacteria)]MBY6685040.1 alkaline phosphatase D family protein [Rhodococcus sp. BP-288]MBY6692476.1 alkaline phosphatase D family protein [Rhodococcus sp. BP-188]MBY6698374.1 alkaline phosphatase D family protein [Rhodococcus sp. BP-285]MBY6701053.1 alkaline phosphatase D family protein [Rhodococcus sp. BP-283]MBY6712054.1 alkaline phosphatase D family protein [Rhodococcus sp. BP-160]
MSRRDLVIGADRSLRAGTTRRSFLTWTALVGALAMTPELSSATAHAQPQRGTPADYPFRLGVASGDPLPDSVVLWTRLAVDPLAPVGGMRPGVVPVRWEIAEDERFGRTVSQGIELASDADGWSVHVDVRGLAPAREYFYRFMVGPHVSTVGRTRTAPAPGSPLASLSFAWASCQKWEDGFYGAYADLAASDPDVVFFLGDYIYEYAIEGTGARASQPRPESAGRETLALNDYRDRYALYKSDPDLASAHAAAPWITTFDDHEVDNNWAGAISQDAGTAAPGDPAGDPRVFLLRRADAFKAWWENTPVRMAQRPTGPDLTAYRRFSFGDLVDFSVLDTRQYRSDQANGDGEHAQNAETADPSRTITGAAQEKWILDGFGSGATWKFLAHQTVISDLARISDGERKVGMDPWSGYEASRHRILDGARDRGITLASIVGDIHRTIVSELRRDYQDDSAPVVGVEIASTSIASGKDGADVDTAGADIAAASPHVKFGNARRGYLRATLTPTEWRSEVRVLDAISVPGAPVRTAATVTVPEGRPEIGLA